MTFVTMKNFNRTATPVTTAGIYRNSTKGVISLSSDGTNWITIADKNLGATQVYNSGDTLSEANCGKCYQWGNNYGFPTTGAINTEYTNVDGTNYGPGNYYSSNVFHTREPRCYRNENMWGETTNTNEARQGPCPNGYHIMSETDLTNLKNLMTALGQTTAESWKQMLKLPNSGSLNNNGGQTGYGVSFVAWTSTPSSYVSPGYKNAKRLMVGTTIQDNTESSNTYGFSIRPFKDTPVQPDDGGDWETLYTPPEILNFTANTAGSTITLNKYRSPYVVTLETSTDGTNWSTYTFGSTITLSNIGDKVYWRNTSETPTGFSSSSGSYYFTMTGSISASGDVNFLLCKNSTDAIQSQYCFNSLFGSCTSLIKPPRLPATTLQAYCYQSMFSNCSNLEELPELPATTLQSYCYQYMFATCSKIKISTTQTGVYQTEYRIPTTGTGTAGTNSLNNMFGSTGGTFTGTPTINTTYYTSNQVI